MPTEAPNGANVVQSTELSTEITPCRQVLRNTSQVATGIIVLSNNNIVADMMFNGK